MRIAESYIEELKKLAKDDTKLVLPMDMSSIESVMETVKQMLKV